MSARIATPPRKIFVKDMEVGQIGTFLYGDATVIALRTFDGIVDLNKPRHTWGHNAQYEVELLPPGSKIEVVAE